MHLLLLTFLNKAFYTIISDLHTKTNHVWGVSTCSLANCNVLFVSCMNSYECSYVLLMDLDPPQICEYIFFFRANFFCIIFYLFIFFHLEKIQDFCFAQTGSEGTSPEVWVVNSHTLTQSHPQLFLQSRPNCWKWQPWCSRRTRRRRRRREIQL